MKKLSYEELLDIAASLEDYHKVFYVFWEMSSVVFDDSIGTAAVRFPRAGKPEMLIGEKFWNSLTKREKLFVVCHECLHVLLDHGVRNGLSVPGASPRLVNIAQDITINEMIVDLFSYDREDLRDWKKYCWIDTCFDNPHVIARNETFLYYLEKLIQNPPKGEEQGGPSTFDEHGMQPDGSIKSPQPSGGKGDETQAEKDAKQATAESLAGELTAQELDDLLKALPEGVLEAGQMTGAIEHIIARKVQRAKLKFGHIVRKLKKSCLKEVPADVETFTQDDRRFSDVHANPKIALPGKGEIMKPSRDRLLTAVFMDVSGSCLDYLKVFNQVFLAFDAERKLFETRLFIFDTRVTEVRPGDNVRIGGGTAFDIIEQKCVQLESEVGRYPDCVVVITDGHGSPVTPKAPTKWIWLLTPKDHTTHYVPRQSRHFLISQVTFESTVI